MEIRRLPSSLLEGKFLHCQPVEDGPIIEAPIVSSEEGSTPVFNVVIVCPVRRPSSNCALRMVAGSQDVKCQYWEGDSCGQYQIVGPKMDRKSEY